MQAQADHYLLSEHSLRVTVSLLAISLLIIIISLSGFLVLIR